MFFIWLPQVQIIILGCSMFGCWVLWVGSNSDSLPILQSLSSGCTGKMVKKVCPCNQLCSNYLSFCSSSLHPFPSSILHPCICSPMLSPALWCPLDLHFDPQIWDQFSSAISATVYTRNRENWNAAEITELSSHHRVKLTVHAPACSLTHTRTHNSPEQLFATLPWKPPPPPPFPLLPRHGLWSGLHCPEFHAAAVSHDSASCHFYFPTFYLAWHDSFCRITLVYTW